MIQPDFRSDVRLFQHFLRKSRFDRNLRPTHGEFKIGPNLALIRTHKDRPKSQRMASTCRTATPSPIWSRFGVTNALKVLRLINFRTSKKGTTHAIQKILSVLERPSQIKPFHVFVGNFVGSFVEIRRFHEVPDTGAQNKSFGAGLIYRPTEPVGCPARKLLKSFNTKSLLLLQTPC